MFRFHMRGLFSLIAILSIALIFSHLPLSCCQTSPTQPHPFLYDPKESGEWTEIPTSHPDSIFSKFTNKKGLAFSSAIFPWTSYLVLMDSQFVDREPFMMIYLDRNDLEYRSSDRSRTLQNKTIVYQIGDDFYNFDNMTSHSCTVGEMVVKEDYDRSLPIRWRSFSPSRLQVKVTGGDCPFSFETNFMAEQVPKIEKSPRPFFDLVREAGRHYGKWHLDTTTGANELVSGWGFGQEGVAMTYFATDGRPYLELLYGKYLDDNSYFGWENKTTLNFDYGKYSDQGFKGFVTIFLNLLEELERDTGTIKKENHLIQYTYELESHTCIAKELTITLSGSWWTREAPTIHIKAMMEESCLLGSFETDSLTYYNQLLLPEQDIFLKMSYIWVILSVIANLFILKGPRNVNHLKQLHLTAIITIYCYEEMILVATEALGSLGLTAFSFLLMSAICFEIYVIIMCYPPDEYFVTKVQSVLWFFGLRLLIFIASPNNPFIVEKVFFVIPLLWITYLLIRQFLEIHDLPRYPFKLIPNIIIMGYIKCCYKDFMGQYVHLGSKIAIAIFFLIYCGLLIYLVCSKRRQEYSKMNVSSANNVVNEQQSVEDVEEGQ